MKKPNDLSAVVAIRESLLSLQVCSSIPPERAHEELTDAVREHVGPSGTSSGWVYEESIDSVECADYEGRWHYICLC